MIPQLSEEDLTFLELLHDPIALIENIVPAETQSPYKWDENIECIQLRTYQLPFLSYEYHILDDPKLSKKENFRRKIKAGQIYIYGGRKIGKSFCTIDLDNLVNMFLNSNMITALASFDEYHLKERAEFACSYVENHPLFKMLHRKGQKSSVSRKPYRIELKNGVKVIGINENITSKEPGKQYHQHHYHRFYYEEQSYESMQGFLKRIDSISELGCIERLSAIPALRKGSPAYNYYYDEKKSAYLIKHLPQFVSPMWDENQKKEAVKGYGGEGSDAYKLNVLGEVIEGAFGRFDIERINKCVNEGIEIVNFEINKENYHRYNELLIVNQIPGAECNYICADIGDQASPSEIVVIFKRNKQFYYRYNITLLKLTDEEQANIILHLYKRLGSGFIGIDTTDGTGRAVYRRLIKIVGENNCIAVSFNKNIPIDFQKDEHGYVVFNRKGEPLLIEENTLEWANQQLEYLFYNNLLEIPYDIKLQRELSGYVIVQVGNRKIHSSSTTDHLLQAFQVFAITRWMTEWVEQKPKSLNLGLGA